MFEHPEYIGFRSLCFMLIGIYFPVCQFDAQGVQTRAFNQSTSLGRPRPSFNPTQHRCSEPAKIIPNRNICLIWPGAMEVTPRLNAYDEDVYNMLKCLSVCLFIMQPILRLLSNFEQLQLGNRGPGTHTIYIFRILSA